MSDIVNGVQLNMTNHYDPVLVDNLRRLAVAAAPDPTELPDGTVLRVVNGVWVSVEPAVAPSVLAKVTETISSIDLSWTNGDPTLETELWDGVTLLFTEQDGVASKSVTGLAANSAHVFKVRHRVGQFFSAYSSPLTAYTLPANIAGAPTSGAQTQTTIDIAWTNADATALTEIWVDDGLGGAFSKFSTEAAAATTKQITGLSAGLTYIIKLKHKGALSALVSASFSPTLSQATQA
jgi:hypothetical protein